MISLKHIKTISTEKNYPDLFACKNMISAKNIPQHIVLDRLEIFILHTTHAPQGWYKRDAHPKIIQNYNANDMLVC